MPPYGQRKNTDLIPSFSMKGFSLSWKQLTLLTIAS